MDILKIHSRRMNLTRGINLRKIAESMPGASGAEIKVIDISDMYCCQSLSSEIGRYCSCNISFMQGVCTEAGMYALRERRVHVTQEDFEMAVGKVGQTASTTLLTL